MISPDSQAEFLPPTTATESKQCYVPRRPFPVVRLAKHRAPMTLAVIESIPEALEAWPFAEQVGCKKWFCSSLPVSKLPLVLIDHGD